MLRSFTFYSCCGSIGQSHEEWIPVLKEATESVRQCPESMVELSQIPRMVVDIDREKCLYPTWTRIFFTMS